MDSKKVFDLIAEHGPDGARKLVKMPQQKFDELVEAYHRKHFKKFFGDAPAVSTRTVIDDKKRHERHERSESSESSESSSEASPGHCCGCSSSGESSGSDSSDSSSDSSSGSDEEVDCEDCVFVCTAPSQKTKKGALFCSQCKMEGHTKKTCLKGDVKGEKSVSEKTPTPKKTPKKKQKTAKMGSSSNTLKTLTTKFNGLSKKEKDAFLKLVF